MFTIEPQLFYGALGALFMATAFFVRQWAITRSYTGQKQADGNLITTKAQADLVASVARTADSGVVALKNVIEVVQENTKAATESAAQTQGMLLMFKEFQSDLNNVTIGRNEDRGHISDIKSGVAKIEGIAVSLETNLDESIGKSIKDKFGMVVQELKNIGARVEELVTEVQTKDGKTDAQLAELIGLFKDAETRFTAMFESRYSNHMAELLPVDTIPPNGIEKE